MEWVVKIAGEGFVLREWANALPSEEFRITLDGDEFVLRSPLHLAINNVYLARDKAKEILESINGIARLRLGAQEHVKIVYLQRTADDGKSTFFVELGGNQLSSRGSLGIPQSLWPPVEIAQHDQNVATVLRLIATQGFTWVNLYRIFEIIRADVGRETTIIQHGWATADPLNRFRRSSNHPLVSGDEARHGTDRSLPPANPMSLSEANSFLKSILSDWLSWKEDNPQPSP